MTDTLKCLAQSNPAASTLTALYTVPAATSTSVSSIFVCNQDTLGATFSVSVAVGGAADNSKQYMYYQTPLDTNDTFVATAGLSLAAGDVVRVWSSSAHLSFNLFGVEVS